MREGTHDTERLEQRKLQRVLHEGRHIPCHSQVHDNLGVLRCQRPLPVFMEVSLVYIVVSFPAQRLDQEKVADGRAHGEVYLKRDHDGFCQATEAISIIGGYIFVWPASDPSAPTVNMNMPNGESLAVVYTPSLCNVSLP